MAKLQNIKAIRQMLDGTHFTQTRQTVGFSDAEATKERNKKREVGEKWPELDAEGNVIAIWEQKQGYRIKSSPNAEELRAAREYIQQYPNCLDDCRTKEYDKLDKRFRAKFGRCADCQFRLETKMKFEGTFKDYERKQMLANATAFFEQADKEIEIVVDHMSGKHGYVNQDGSAETWEGDAASAEKLREEYYAYKKVALDTLKKYK